MRKAIKIILIMAIITVFSIGCSTMGHNGDGRSSYSSGRSCH